MFKKILVANRGEVASRVIRTCQKLGIPTVAIYSDADQQSPHTTLAEESFLVGGPQVKESYLNIDNILRIAHQTGADAIHPGYGFLSENVVFATRCKEEGITFIGPGADVISQMGRKIEARQVMEDAGIPVIPGITRVIENDKEAAHEAMKIGYPVMLKASAGGGGIGIQIAYDEKELRQAFSGNKKRAADFFGNGDMYVEKYIEKPRHIEIQVLADSKGNTVHLWERECSIQRRHQKIVEEAPSPFLDEQMRKKMGEAAVKAAKSISYVNAGTIEFLVDKEKNFYFLEMNTRLQVEHPVTEEITGLDLVEEQLKIASGKCLTFSQKEVKRQGHAIEVRVYAEDPVTFFPSPGQIRKLRIPQGSGVRNEIAVTENFTVTPYYDPMIAKLITTGKNRKEAIKGMKKALYSYEVEGIKTNIPVLQKVIQHEAFQKGDTTTDFIMKYF